MWRLALLFCRTIVFIYLFFGSNDGRFVSKTSCPYIMEETGMDWILSRCLLEGILSSVNGNLVLQSSKYTKLSWVPFDSRNSKTPAWPNAAAFNKGVIPSFLFCSMSNPLSKSSFIVGWEPDWQARCKALSPKEWDTTLKSAPWGK